MRATGIWGTLWIGHRNFALKCYYLPNVASEVTPACKANEKSACHRTRVVQLTARKSYRRQKGKISWDWSEDHGRRTADQSTAEKKEKVHQPAALTEGQKEFIVRTRRPPSTAGSSRKSWPGETKEQLIKLSTRLIRQAVGSDSRGRRLSCRRIKRTGQAKTEQGQSGVWLKGAADWVAVWSTSCDSSSHSKGSHQ